MPEAAERYRNPEQTDRRQRDCDGRRGGIGAVRVTNGSDARHRRVDAVCRAEGARHRRVGAAVLWAPIAVAALPVAFAFGPQAKALVPTAVSVVAGLVTQTGCATACRGAKLIQSATDKPVKPQAAGIRRSARCQRGEQPSGTAASIQSAHPRTQRTGLRR